MNNKYIFWLTLLATLIIAPDSKCSEKRLHRVHREPYLTRSQKKVWLDCLPTLPAFKGHRPIRKKRGGPWPQKRNKKLAPTSLPVLAKKERKQRRKEMLKTSGRSHRSKFPFLVSIPMKKQRLTVEQLYLLQLQCRRFQNNQTLQSVFRRLIRQKTRNFTT